jgi:DNA-binding HxlR family transcriptional regulator
VKFKDEQRAALQSPQACATQEQTDPRVEALVTELIGRVADKWTMMIIEVLTEHGDVRFTRLSEMVPGISYKMLTQTLRQMEREGLVARTVHPVIPPKVEYRLTNLGLSLSAAFCGVWLWAEEHLEEVETARAAFDSKRVSTSGHAEMAANVPAKTSKSLASSKKILTKREGMSAPTQGSANPDGIRRTRARIPPH